MEREVYCDSVEVITNWARFAAENNVSKGEIYDAYQDGITDRLEVINGLQQEVSTLREKQNRIS